MLIVIRKIIRLGIYTTIILIIIGLSELIYTYNNRPEYLALYYLWLAKRTSSEDVTKSLNYLSKGAEHIINGNSKLYKTLVPKNYKPRFDLYGQTPEFTKEYISYMNSLDIVIETEGEKVNQSYIFYKLGILANKEDSQELAKLLLHTAVYLSPDLGHYHLELANYYLVTGNLSEAEIQIEYCLEFKYPDKQCNEYKYTDLANNTRHEVGYLDNDLKNYYNNQLLKAEN